MEIAQEKLFKVENYLQLCQLFLILLNSMLYFCSILLCSVHNLFAGFEMIDFGRL